MVLSGYVKRKLDEFMSKNVTIVTGLWDLGREHLSGWAQRDFTTYKNNFFRLLKSDVPMCIWIPKELEEDVWKIRHPHNTKIFHKEVEDFKTWFPFFQEHDALRKNPEWYNSVGWLSNSPQAALEMYNPMMMTKVFMVHDSSIHNPFDTEYFYWIDGGLTSTVSDGYFSNGEIFDNISNVYSDKIVHITYPYVPSTEIHGFEKSALYKFCGIPNSEETVFISRGGFWGGNKQLISEYNRLYYNILSSTINSGNIGADECLFTILAHKYPNLIDTYRVEGNGLVWPFFEALKDEESVLKNFPKKEVTHKTAKVNLYILGFNSPEQFQSICESIKKADITFFTDCRKILVNNSIDTTTFKKYDELCEEYSFEEIHKDNLGVCGGRQFVAEHFQDSDADFYMFFEDDMHLNNETDQKMYCRNGFRKYVPNLFHTALKIIIKEKFDFLKFSFSEFYGDNSVQWSWYNVPQSVRSEIWPNYDELPKAGIDLNAPKTEFSFISYVDEIPYITGDIYYSNWPQIVSRKGNHKMFLETIWEHPFEQTWMSHIFQKMKKKEITAGVLLASPVSHERFVHYDSSIRKES